MRPRLELVPLRQPVFITGLARAGSTILLECLHRHPDVATHRYRDYPFLFTPYWWNLASRFAPKAKAAPAERAHGDGIFITPDSPEAMEEMLWMHFFPHLHDPARDNRLTEAEDNSAFAAFYRDHIRKLLLLHKRSRYVAKNNYLLARLGYLHRLFPDMRVVVPVRDPVTHVASLMRQHARFKASAAQDAKVVEYFRASGHFEFGADRRPVHHGDDERQEHILSAWQEGREVEGWAHSWCAMYEYLLLLLSQNPALKEAVMVVRHEDLCADPRNMLADIFAHCRLPLEDALLAQLAGTIRPEKKEGGLADDECRLIRAITGPVAGRYGY